MSENWGWWIILLYKGSQQYKIKCDLKLILTLFLFVGIWNKIHWVGWDPNPKYLRTTSKNQFSCQHCGKRYRWKSTLKRHETFECGGKEPVHQCPFCDYRAKQSGNLRVHIRKYHQSLWCLVINYSGILLVHSYKPTVNSNKYHNKSIVLYINTYIYSIIY